MSVNASTITRFKPAPGGRYVIHPRPISSGPWNSPAGKQKISIYRSTLATSFVDKDRRPRRPQAGVRRWRLDEDDQAVLLYEKLDIGEVKPDGNGATRLTNGAAGEVRHRLVRFDPDADWSVRSSR